MKNSVILILFTLISVLFINSCVDEIVVDGPKNQGKLIIDSDPPGAQIFFMGTNTHLLTPDSILGLESGNYQVTLKKDDCCDTTLNVKVYDKLTTSINTKLMVEKKFGNLFLESIPDGAAIYLNGININKITPDTIDGLETGVYQVTLKKDNYVDSSFNAAVFKDSTVSISAQLTHKEPGKGNLFIESVPNGANIYLSGEDTKKITPDSILNLTEGDYQINLSKGDYSDTTFNINIKDKVTVSRIIQLISTKTTGSIFLQSVPNGAQIFISGTNTNKTTPEGIVNLEQGDYQFTLTSPGYLDTTFNVAIIKGQRIDKTIILKKISESGSILLESSPAGAQIFIEGVNTNKITPAAIQNLDQGQHQFTLKLSGYKDTTFNATILTNQQVNKNITLTPQVNTGSLLLQSTPSGAQVFISGINTNKLTPVTIQDLNENSYQVTLKLNGYKDTTVTVSIIKNQQVTKNISLTPQINTGSMLLQSTPSGAQIFLSGINTNKLTPATIQGLNEGSYQVTLKLSGYKDTTVTVSVIKNQQVTKNISLTPQINTGSMLLQSIPAGAQIFLENINTNKFTPSVIQDIEEGSHHFTLKLSGYKDSTFYVTIIKNQQATKNITLKEITTGSILLQSVPAGAQVFLEGNNTDKQTPSTIENLEQGSYKFTLKLGGYYDTTFNITIIKNQQINKNITLTGVITTGSILLQSVPGGAQIFLDDTNTNQQTPSTVQNIEEGLHQFTLKLSGYNDTTFSATIIRNQQINKNVTLTKEIITGTLFVSSEPSGANIFLNNNNSGRTTPNTFYDLSEGSYSVTLKLNYYRDTTVNSQIVRRQLTSENIILTEANPVAVSQITTRKYIQEIRFTFSFNQDILLNKVEIFEPNSGESQTFSFSNQYIKKGSTAIANYPKVVSGTWRLVFYGTKYRDSKTDFVIESDKDVN